MATLDQILQTSLPAGGTSTVTNETASSSTYYPVFANTSSGTFSANASSSKLTFVPSTGTLGATIFNSLSDENKKENIQTVQNALSVIAAMRGVSFTWKNNGEASLGVIAQEVEQVLPELVSTSEDGTKSVNYSGIIAILIESIKDLSERVSNLENR